MNQENAITTAGLAIACVSAVVWAIGLAIWQPLTEPAKPWHDVVAGNNTYWARDLRYLAIAAAIAGVVLVFQGSRFRATLAAFGALGWVGLDVWLDRLDVAGVGAAVVLSVVACAVLAVVCLADRRRPGSRSYRTLVTTAAIAAAMMPLAGTVQSADDTATSAYVVAARTLLGVALVTIAVACALTATAAPGRTRLIGAIVLVVAAGAGVHLLGTVLMDAVEGDVYLGLAPIAGLGFVVFAGLTLLISARRPSSVLDWLGYVLVSAYSTVGYAFLFLYVIYGTATAVPVPGLLTALAGNPPVNAADWDVLLVLCGLVAGLVFAFLLTLVNRGRDRLHAYALSS